MIVQLLGLFGRRLVVAIPILLIVSALVFVVLRVLPVDPAAMSMPPNATKAEIELKRQEMGLDRPLPQQYAIWLGRTVRGDLGASIHFRRAVSSLIAETLPATVELALLAMLIAAGLGFAG
ncbi:MAG: ABC transporter permease, partial [Hyphomicrobiales bacterium]|nr:ABC transporter permease [Hyphomicrobiales bacterium]